MKDPQGAFVTRETSTGPLKLTMWRNGQDIQVVEMNELSAINLAVDLLLHARMGIKDNG